MGESQQDVVYKSNRDEMIRALNEYKKAHPDVADSEDFKRLTSLVNYCVGELGAHIQELGELARVDALTGLGNRRAYDEALVREAKRALSRNHPLSLIRLDLDHFKPINDTYGHAAGDVIIVSLANLLKRHIQTDDIPCRYGGDEFAILLPETDLKGALAVAARIYEGANSAIYDIGGAKVGPVTVSQGIDVLLPPKGTPIDYRVASLELSQNADKACYSAKGERNCIWVYGEENPRIAAHRIETAGRDETALNFGRGT